MIAALIVAVAAAAPPEANAAPRAARPFTLTVKVDKDEVSLGEPFVVTMRVEHAPLDVYALSEPLAVEPLSLRGAPSVSRTAKGDRAETTFELPLVNVKTLDPRLPAVKLRVDGPEGPRELEVPETPIRLRSLVAEEHAPDAEHAHHGPKPPVPVMVRSFLWVWVAGAAALLIAALF
ncbi:MAG TPA: hypothetical protein VG496_18655, partial [Myxococcales bacterium]|nr:hypothetical protein [Myxococcales bacterium]